MTNLHYIVVLAQLVAEGKRQHRSHAAFGQWVRNDPEVRRLTRGDPLSHQDRAALIKIAQLDPEEASAAIRRHGSWAGPERLWRDVLRHLAARKTPPAPERKTADAAVRETAPEPARKTVEATARNTPGADGDIVAPRPRMTEAEYDAESQKLRDLYGPPDGLMSELMAKRDRALVNLYGPKPELEPLEPKDEEDYADKVEEFLERLRLASGDASQEPEDWYAWFDEEVLELVRRLDLTTNDNADWVFETWLGSQALFVLDYYDRNFMSELTFDSRRNDIWNEVVERNKPLMTPRPRGRRRR